MSIVDNDTRIVSLFRDAAAFLAAEREIAEADRLADGVNGSADDAAAQLEPIHDRYNLATNFIDSTAPQSLPAVIVKLRRLLSDSSPLSGYDHELVSLTQCITFLERLHRDLQQHQGDRPGCRLFVPAGL